MTTIRDRGTPAEPGSPLAHLYRGVHLIGLVHPAWPAGLVTSFLSPSARIRAAASVPS